MLRWCAVLAFVLAVPAVQACSPDGAGSSSLSIDLVKPAGCARTSLAACDKVPEADLPVVYDGVLVWSWDLDACSTTVPTPSPVHIHLQGLDRESKGWLAVAIDPAEVTLGPQDQWDVIDDGADPGASGYRGREEVPIRLTVSLVGEPDEAMRSRVGAAGGAVALFAKASADATPTFTASFALEQVVLDGGAALQASGTNGAPLPPLLPAAGTALAALLRGRRR